MIVAHLVCFLFIGLQGLLLWQITGAQLLPALAGLLAGAAVVPRLLAPRAAASSGATLSPAAMPSPIAMRPWRSAGRTLAAVVAAVPLTLGIGWLESTGEAAEVTSLSVTLATRAVEGLLVLQALATWRSSVGGPPTHRISGFVPGLGLFTLLLLFSVVTEDRRPGESKLILVLLTAAAAMLFHCAERRGRSSLQVRNQAASLLAGVLFCSLLIAWNLSHLWSSQSPQVQRWLQSRVSWAAGHAGQTLGYVRLGTLDAITRQQLSNPQHVALRVYAERTPGYLRGRVYDSYSKLRWRSSTDRRGKWNGARDERTVGPAGKRPRELRPPARDRTLFALRADAPGPWNELEIWNDPRRGNLFFTPLHTCFIEGQGRKLVIDADGILDRGLSTEFPYTAFVSETAPRQILEPQLERRYLEPLEGVDQELIAALAESVCGKRATAQGKIEAVTEFFRENFEYSTQPFRVPPQRDRLSYFLLRHPPAHCEYFATGAIALLRASGIPCRYVIGYVVKELETEYGDYWIARNRHAHAWAEAYDRERQQWITVEATPGMHLPETLTANTELASSQAQDLRFQTSRRGDGGLLGQWWRQTRGARYWIVGGLGVTLGVLWLVPAFRPWVRRRQPSRERVRSECRRLMRRLEAPLARRGLRRRPSETLRQFARRLHEASSPDAPWLAQAARWYLLYAEQCYRESFDAQQLRAIFPQTSA